MRKMNNTYIVINVVTLMLLILFLVSFVGNQLSISTVYAQTDSASLRGQVVDESNLPIVGADIEIIRIETQQKISAQTNQNGLFVFHSVLPGRYKLKVTRTGFATVEVKEIVLNVGDRKVVSNIELKVGDINDSVTVSDVSLISEDATVGTVIDRNLVANLPLNGRSFQSLMTLTPGVVLTKSSFSEQGQFSVNGQRPDANYFTIDGVSANIGASASILAGQGAGGAVAGTSIIGGTNNLISIDALEEFKIQTSTFAPEYGRAPGAQISAVTRSGSNALHGSLFEYFRNDKLDSNDWFTNASGLKKSALRQNIFGGLVNGPIVKDKLFYFASFEGMRLRLPRTKVTDVPSLSVRQSDLLSAAMRPFLNAYPKPNGAEGRNGFATFTASYSDPSSLDAGSIRIDSILNSKNALFGRFNYSPSETTQRGLSRFSLNSLSNTSMTTKTLTMGLTSSITPRINNDFRFNYSTNSASNNSYLDDYGGASVPSESVLFPSPFTNSNAQLIFGAFQGRNSFIVSGKNITNEQKQINIIDNLSMDIGTHKFKFGGDFRRLSPVRDIRPYDQFVGFLTAAGAGNTPVSGSLLSGRPFFIDVSSNDANTLFFNNYSLYLQDTWRIKPRFALTYGARWDINPPPSGEKELLTINEFSDPADISLAPAGTPLYKTKFNNIAPRVGMSYQILSKPKNDLVLRGGFGVFFDVGNGTIGDIVAGYPFTRLRTLPLFTPYPVTDPALIAPPTINPVDPIGLINVPNHNLESPRTYQWSLSTEYIYDNKHTISLSYIGSVGRKLLMQEIYRAGFGLNPNFVEVNITSNGAESNYQGLQAQYVRRMSRNFQIIAGYTWSHSIDTLSSSSTFNIPSLQIASKLNRGSSDFDVRHSATGALVYDLPNLSNAPKIVKALINSWSVNGMVTSRSGTPVEITSFRQIGAEFVPLRPDLILGVPLYIYDSSLPGGRKINIDAFSIPTELRQGNLGRNALRGFSMYQIDLSLQRQFSLSESKKIQFKVDFFNILNHPNFGDPVSDLDFPSFGISERMLGRSLGAGGLGGGFSPLYQIGGPRSIQLALKFLF